MASRTGESRSFNWKLVVVLVLGVAVLSGTIYKLHQWRLASTARQSLEAGKKAYEAKDWQTAATQIGRYVAVHPGAIDELLMYADAQIHIQPQKENNVLQAVNAYLQVLRQNPEHPEASDRVSQLYVQMRLPADAINILERRLKAGNDPAARQLYAMALAMTGKNVQAAQEFGKVIESSPGEVTAYQRLAELARMRPEEITTSPLEILKKAVARNPNSAQARVALGTYLERYGEGGDARRQAKAEYDAARQMDLGDVNTRIGLAAGLIEMGDFAAAREQLEAAKLQGGGGLPLWLTWAELIRVDGTPAEAEAVARESLAQLGTEAYPFLGTAAELLIYAKNYAEARKVLEDIRATDARHNEIPYIEGLLAQGEGNTREAIKIWQGAVGPGRASGRVRMVLADAYLEVNDPAAAIRELRLLAGQFPNMTRVRMSLAKVLGQSGAWREAATHAKAAVDLAPQNVEARVLSLSARAHVAVLDDGDENVWRGLNKEMAQLRASAPDSTVVRLLAADIAQMQGDTKVSAQAAEALVKNEETRLQGLQLETETLWRAGRAEEAIAKGREAIGLYPGATGAVMQLSDMLIRGGDMTGAIAAVEEGLKNADAQGRKELETVLAQIYVRSGDAAKAKGLLERIISEDKGDVISRMLLINLTDIKETSTIQRLIDQIREAEGEGGFRWKYHQARLWLFSEDWRAHVNEASELLKSNIKGDPRDINSQLLLGVAEEKAQRLSLAIECYRKAYQQAPDSALVVFYLVGALQKNNNIEEAGQILDRAASQGISEPRLASLRLGQQLRQGQTDLAIQTTEEMIRQRADNISLRIFLANLKMREKDLEGAHAILDALDPANTEVAMAKVELLMREGKKDEAEALSDSIVEKLDNAASHVFRARVLTAMGELDKAEADYQTVTQLEPSKIQSWALLSDFLVARKKTVEATTAIERALDIDSKNPLVVTRAVRLYAVNPDAKVRRSADDLMEASLKANPEDAELTLFQAQRLIGRRTLESLAAARRTLDELARKRPEMVPVWRLAAQAALLEGQSDSAIEAISKGLAAEPDDAQRRALLVLKAQAERVKYPVLAAATLRGLWDRDHKDIMVGLALASAYVDSGEGRKALPVIEEMKKLVQGKEAAMLELAAAEALFAAGDTQEAVARAREAKAGADNDPRPMITLVKMLAKTDRIEESLAVVRDWQKTYPQDKTGIFMAGQALVAAGTAPARPGAAAEQKSAKIQEAVILVFDSATATYPEELSFKMALGQALQARGHNQEAEKVYREILSKAPDNPVALNNLAWMLAEDDAKLDAALELADRGRQKFPDFAELIDTRGVIYRRLGRLKEAEKELREAVKMSSVSSPAIASARFHLAGVLAESGKKDEAMRYANESLGGPAEAQLSPQDRMKAEELLSQLTSGAAGDAAK